MPYPIFDSRHDIRNLFITPQIRGRFLRMAPGEVHARHSHDLGDELFLILDGQCDMEIEGHRAMLGPGQACVAFAHQMHQARNAGAGPMTMYLSVTPHIEPTHTHYDQATGERLPPHYNPVMATQFIRPAFAPGSWCFGATCMSMRCTSARSEGHGTGRPARGAPPQAGLLAWRTPHGTTPVHLVSDASGIGAQDREKSSSVAA